MRRTKALLWVVATAAALGSNAVLGSTTTIKATTQCESGSYLDISGLECAACGDNEEVTSDGLSCQCTLGTIRIVSPPSVQPTSLAESAGGDGFTECSRCARATSRGWGGRSVNQQEPACCGKSSSLTMPTPRTLALSKRRTNAVDIP